MSSPSPPSTETDVGDDIVLVDDDPMVAEFVRRVLRGHAWSLRVIDDPRDALDHLEAHTAGVLIVDTRMPGMDGPELLVRLAERGRRGARHVLLYSASRVTETEWTRRLPSHVERVSKDEFLDRHTLASRLGELLGSTSVERDPEASGPTPTGNDVGAGSR